MKMRKTRIFSGILAAIMVAMLLTSCGGGSSSAAVKTGFGAVLSAAKSKPAVAGEPGLAESNTTLAAVTVDKNGKIIHCVLDGVQAKINFGDDGLIQTPLNTVVKSKNELGDEYGMKKASGIGKEWNEQAASFAKYVTGKTLAEVKGIAVNEKGAPTSSDLTSMVTISIGDFVAALEKAVNSAADIGAKKGDKLGLGAATNIAKSTDATAEAEGLAQSYSTFAALTFEGDKITSCLLDGSQTNVSFDKKGELMSDVKAPQRTKNELGEGYGMKKASGIGKEWNEQAAALAKYVTGKTLNEVKGIAVNDNGAPTATDLKSMVTVSIGDFIAAIEIADKTKK